MSWASLNSISCNKNNCYRYLANRFEWLEKCLQHLPLDFAPFPLGKSAGLPPRDETMNNEFCSLFSNKDLKIMYFLKAEIGPYWRSYPEVCHLVHWLHQLLLHSLKHREHKKIQHSTSTLTVTCETCAKVHGKLTLSPSSIGRPSNRTIALNRSFILRIFFLH